MNEQSTVTSSAQTSIRLPVPKARVLLTWAITAVLLYAGSQKLIYASDFRELLRSSKTLPAGIVPVISAVTPWMEIAASICLLVRAFRTVGLAGTSMLFWGFAGYEWLRFAHGDRTPCGCLSPAFRIPPEFMILGCLTMGFAAAGLFVLEVRP
jgi:hypothetical protein